MPFGLHPFWAVALVVIVLILFGVGRLPQIGEALGKSIVGFRKSFRGEEQKPPAEPKKD
ncbi:MAG TPA: twin-arginine translocase TatA/TatE family subunit [Candidatus Eisenbacteria bacterium]|jgi:sec-independent protein translocase protein TatA|nr:twin-arginine translocase TatA/TatE family subunit [Candidatus Eisenbacteria bacterium]